MSYGSKHASPSLYYTRHFVRTYTHSSKTKGCIWTYNLSNDMLSTIRDIYLCVRAVCEIRLKSYMASTTHRSLFPLKHLCVLTCMCRSYRDVLHIERLFNYRRYPLCGLELRERSCWRATASDIHRSFSDTTLCAYPANPCIHCYLVSMKQNSPTLRLHATLQMTAFLPMRHHFIVTKLASYALSCSVFSINRVR